jgi:putative hydrolase of the HAD superfamily
LEIHAVIFDLDETLLDNSTSADLAWKRFQSMISSQGPIRGLGYELERYFPTVASENRFLLNTNISPLQFRIKIFEKILKRFRVKEFLELAQTLGRIFDICQQSTFTLFPEVGSVLSKVSQQVPIALLSNGQHDYQYEKLVATGIKSVFKKIIISSELKIEKPHRDIFLEMCHQLSVRPDQALMVGDNLQIDIWGGFQAGLQVAWLNRNPLQQRVEPLPPDFLMLKQLEELAFLFK